MVCLSFRLRVCESPASPKLYTEREEASASVRDHGKGCAYAKRSPQPTAHGYGRDNGIPGPPVLVPRRKVEKQHTPYNTVLPKSSDNTGRATEPFVNAIGRKSPLSVKKSFQYRDVECILKLSDTRIWLMIQVSY